MALYISSVAVERDVWRNRGELSDDHDDHQEVVHQFFRDLPHGDFPVLASMAAAMATGGPDERFEFGMDDLIAGVDALARRS